MPFATVVWSPLVGLFLVLTLVSLVLGLTVTIVRFLRGPRPAIAIVIILLARGLASVGSVGYAVYRSYEIQNTWSFGYSLRVQGNGTAPESLVVPIVGDESLLAGLHLTSGTANWSIVDTPRGRGLFVQFTRTASMEASESRFPPPAVVPDTSPTMTVSTNCTAQPSNCTGPPSVWVFYSGPAGARVGLSASSLYFSAFLSVGWASYETWPIPMPQA
jgi:hypothetical protein